MPHRTLVLVVLVVAGLLSTTVVPASAADDVAVVEYRPPSPAAIVDRFDLPDKPWQAGNRGIDYGTVAGDPVAAAADGEVVFAGSVAGAPFVTVRHADELRTSYGVLGEIHVRVGQRVRAGDVVGLARGPFNFGVRAPDDTYLDPELLLAGLLEPRVRLVPGAEEGVDPLRERQSIMDRLRGGGAAFVSFVAETGGAALDLVDLAGHYLVETNPVVRAVRVVGAMRSWYDQQQNCTSGSTPTPDRHGERRIAVVVSGLGTTSGGNSAWEIDTGTLGYAVDDVVRFSYAGGRAPRADEPPGWSGRGARNDVEFARALDPGLEDIPDSLFDESDSQQSIDVSADRLGELLRQVAVAEPDVPIDVLSHSQGGVVARLGVVEAGADGNLPATVENLVTIGSPHQGAPMATAIEAIQASPAGRAGLGAVRDSGVAEGLDDRLPAITQLSETSAVLDHMRSLPIPEGVRFTALGGSGDLTVPAPVTGDPQADVHHVIPTPTGADAHGDLASLPATTREIALATAGIGPSCQSWRQALGIAMQSDTIRSTEAMVGAAGLVATTTAAVPNVVAALVED